MPNNSVSEIKKYLEGVNFPADKTELVEHAKQQQAPSQLIDLLQQLSTPEFGSTNAEHMTEYNSLDELIQEIQQIEKIE